MIKEGKIKKSKALPPVEDDDIPFDLPSGWELAYLGDLGFTQTGTTPSKHRQEYYGDFIPFVKPADISYFDVKYDVERLSEIGLSKGRLIPSGSVLMVE